MLKLKLFGKKDKSAAAVPVVVEDKKTGDASAEEASGKPDEVSEEAALVDIVTQMNACTTMIEGQGETISKLAATNKQLTDQVAKLEGDRSKEIDQAASKKAVQTTAAQGVPIDDIPAGEGEGAMDEPKSLTEFQAAMNSIDDPTDRGSYYQKHSSKFFG